MFAKIPFLEEIKAEIVIKNFKEYIETPGNALVSSTLEAGIDDKSDRYEYVKSVCVEKFALAEYVIKYLLFYLY